MKTEELIERNEREKRGKYFCSVCGRKLEETDIYWGEDVIELGNGESQFDFVKMRDFTLCCHAPYYKKS